MGVFAAEVASRLGTVSWLCRLGNRSEPPWTRAGFRGWSSINAPGQRAPPVAKRGYALVNARSGSTSGK
jgi:hypothetical protein